MDSNHKWIDPEQFWLGEGKVQIIPTYTTEQLEAFARYYDLGDAKHIIISVGTNNIDNTKGDIVALNTIKGAEIVKERNNQSNVYINQLPPRKNRFRKETDDMNTILETHTPESINLIIQNNTLQKDMFDDKHMKKYSMRTVIINMKNKMREVNGSGRRLTRGHWGSDEEDNNSPNNNHSTSKQEQQFQTRHRQRFIRDQNHHKNWNNRYNQGEGADAKKHMQRQSAPPTTSNKYEHQQSIMSKNNHLKQLASAVVANNEIMNNLLIAINNQ